MYLYERSDRRAVAEEHSLVVILAQHLYDVGEAFGGGADVRCDLGQHLDGVYKVGLHDKLVRTVLGEVQMDQLGAECDCHVVQAVVHTLEDK